MKAKHSIVIRSIDRLPQEYGFNQRQRNDLICVIREPDELRDAAYVEVEMKSSDQTFGRFSTQLTESERVLLNRLENKVAERLSQQVIKK